ncbi:MAG: SCP2 sterol-binding domain-containing protein [Colwellia sp.]|nr:SCP2 sterol-binding domain-containing protein [Colwellia sp.]MCW8866207.1 SCP2 sterol-binding domain-containing protein [Colwellia sp.]MCW9082051.1 SCP2 sterol-binding domain-containing protein [Colwellia sp.]
MLNLPSLPQAIPSLADKKALLSTLPLQLKIRMIDVMPKILRPSLRLLPFKAQKAALLSALSSVFKEALEDGDFEFLQDKWLKIAITDLQLTWWLSFDDDKLIMASSEEMAANNISEDVSFSATGDDLVLIAGRKQDPDTLFFQRRLKVEGDTELGLEVKNLIDAIDIEQLPSSVHSLVAYSADFLQTTRDEQSQKEAQK